MKEKLLAALKMSKSPKYAEAVRKQSMSVNIFYSQAGFEKEMARRRYAR